MSGGCETGRHGEQLQGAAPLIAQRRSQGSEGSSPVPKRQAGCCPPAPGKAAAGRLVGTGLPGRREGEKLPRARGGRALRMYPCAVQYGRHECHGLCKCKQLKVHFDSRIGHVSSAPQPPGLLKWTAHSCHRQKFGRTRWTPRATASAKHVLTTSCYGFHPRSAHFTGGKGEAVSAKGNRRGAGKIP